MIKIYITDTGARSVGIGNNSITIIWNLNLETLSSKYREKLREMFSTFCRYHLDFVGRITCYFEDECPNCLSRLKDSKCPNQNCISNGY